MSFIVTAAAISGGAALVGAGISYMGQKSMQRLNARLTREQLALQRQQQGDIQQLLGAGGLQRQLAQQTLDAQRQSQLQQSFEPFQRAEFLSNIYAAGPKSQSTIAASTQPQTSPLAQSIGTGIGDTTA